jgi:MFS transporter, PAT family, beta-lactamase induction signal transducer AmpG
VNLFGLGYRKPYIIIGLLIQCICLIIVPSINPGTHFGLFALMGFLLMMGQALYDTCTDGLALDTTSADEQGTIQGIMVAGRAVGIVLISSVLGLVVEHASWTAAFWGLAALTLLPLPFVFRMREAPRPAERKFEWSAFKSFAKGPVIALGILGALYSLIINGINQIVNPFLDSTFSISYTLAGLFTTFWGIGVIVGGVSGGRLTDRFGQHRSVQIALFISLVTGLGLACILAPWMAWPLVVFFGFAFGFYETVYFALAMRNTDLRIAASMFSILMAIANVGTGIGLGISGVAVDTIGYRWTFVFFALLNLAGLPLIRLVFKEKQTT